MANIIEVKNLSKRFALADREVTALSNINLDIEEGDIYGIIGLSGAGKSTLVRCLNFLEVPTEGSVVIEGRELAKLSAGELRRERTRIGMIFQSYNLLMQKNVLDNICFPLTIHGLPKKEARAKALELLKTVELADKARAYPAQLSGGQRQRVAIARALASDPKILLCDEATSALDPKTTNSILQLLKEINQKLGITIVIITHQMSVVQGVCQHVAIIDQGRIAEKGLVEEIFNHPKSRAARLLIIEGKDPEAWTDGVSRTREEIKTDRKIRIVFSGNSSYEPVISNMILTTGYAVNILLADTRDVGGVAKGQMILGLPEEETAQAAIISYLREHGLAVEEVSDHDQ